MSERLTDDLTAPNAELGVNGIAPDVGRNRVRVTLGEPEPQAPARAQAVLAERYGPIVEVEEGRTVYRQLCDRP